MAIQPIKKTASEDRKEAAMLESLKRHLADPIDLFFLGLPAIFTVRSTGKCQRIGDLWAKTIVVDVKDREQYIK